jgi:hypothetical protein
MPRSHHAISLNLTKKDRAVFNLLCKIRHPHTPYNRTETARELHYQALMMEQQRHGWTDQELAAMLNEELEALK